MERDQSQDIFREGIETVHDTIGLDVHQRMPGGARFIGAQEQVMIFAKVRQRGGIHGRAAQTGGEGFKGQLDIFGEFMERRPGRRPTAALRPASSAMNAWVRRCELARMPPRIRIRVRASCLVGR